MAIAVKESLEDEDISACRRVNGRYSSSSCLSGRGFFMMFTILSHFL